VHLYTPLVQENEMFGLVSLSAKKSFCRRPPARLGLEHLERRDTPSTLTVSVSYGIGATITLSGNLTNAPTPGGQLISISGKATGAAATDASGHYSVTLNASGLGEVDAQTSDGSSNVASVTLTDDAPLVSNFIAIREANNVWEFSGTVTYDRPWTGMQVAITGPTSLVTIPVSANSGGNMSSGECTGTFDVCIQLDGTSDANGVYIAQATDFWGTLSNQANYSISQ
jgi:hypothetical protein